MRLTISTALLLASFFSTFAASIDALLSDLDTNIWIPVSIIWPSSSSPTASVSNPTPEEHEQELFQDLRLRQVTGQAAAGAVPTAAANAVSPVTTYQINVYVDGVAKQETVVYTQVFVAVPDQWPSASAGSIGLGTIKGTIGVVRTKRSLPTQAAMPVAEVGRSEQEEEEGIVLGPKEKAEAVENVSSRKYAASMTSTAGMAAALALGLAMVVAC